MSRSAAIPALGLGLLMALTAAIGLGSSWIGPERILAVLIGEGSRTDAIIVSTLRAPRALLALLAGAALALAGALLQRATRNPLASPAVLGLVDGGAVGVLVFLLVFSDEANALTVSIAWQPVAAALGAFAAAAVIGILAQRRGWQARELILYGVAVAAFCAAIATLLMIAGPVYRAGQALIWLAGSVHQAHWADVAVLAGVLVIAAPALVLMLRPLDQMLLDGGSAMATGLMPIATRIVALAMAAGLTAAAVSFAGGIAFVGLIAPHAAHRLVGPRAALHLPATALLGATIVLCADIVARLAFAPIELPTGLVTALIGAPYFLYLLLRRPAHV